MLVVLNGPPGVGKTTVSRLLADLLPGTVRIEGDRLRAFVPDNPRPFLGRGSTYRAAATLACAYLEMGAPRVLFDYCFLRPAHSAYFESRLTTGLDVRMFTLWAPLPTVRAREQGRSGRSPLGHAVDACHAEMQQHLSTLGTLVDAEAPTAQTIARTLADRLCR